MQFSDLLEYVCVFVCMCEGQPCEMEKHCIKSQHQTGSNISGTHPTHVELK